MSVHVGIDVHRKRSQVAVVNESGEVLANRNVPNGTEPILSVIGGLPLPASVSLSFSPGIATFPDRQAVALAWQRPRTAHATTCCPENQSRRRPSVAHTAKPAWQPLSHPLPHRSTAVPAARCDPQQPPAASDRHRSLGRRNDASRGDHVSAPQRRSLHCELVVDMSRQHVPSRPSRAELRTSVALLVRVWRSGVCPP
jgi:hypothetical protein